MQFNLRKSEDVHSVQFEFEATGSYWERRVASQAIIAAYQGRRVYNGVEAYLIGGNYSFDLKDDGKMLRTSLCWYAGGSRQTREQYVEAVEPAIGGLKDVAEAALAANALAIEVFGTALSELEAHYRGLSTIAAAAAARAEGMQRQLDALQEKHRDPAHEPGGTVRADARRNGTAYLATFKPAREQGGFLRRFARFFGVTRPPQCDACGSDQIVLGGFCVGCRAEAAGERIEYGAAS